MKINRVENPAPIATCGNNNAVDGRGLVRSATGKVVSTISPRAFVVSFSVMGDTGMGL